MKIFKGKVFPHKKISSRTKMPGIETKFFDKIESVSFSALFHLTL
jgi:hypothetical protein